MYCTMKVMWKLFSFVVLMTLLSCQSETKPSFYTITGEAQGSTYALKYIANKEIVSKMQIDSLLLAFDQSLSTYLKDSDISRWNNGDTMRTLDLLFKETFKLSQKIHLETDGLFDPSIGVLVNAYGFGPVKTLASPPNSKQIDSLKQLMTFAQLRWSEDDKIKGYRAGMYLDFNAIAQGYSVDVLVRFLKDKSIDNALVELGGEIRSLGKNTIDDKSWVIGIDDPTQSPDERKLIARITLDNRGMATSGNYRKIKTDPETGAKFVHILNPITGLSEKNNILSVTVLASTAAEADGYATALMLMSISQIQEWSSRFPEVDLLVLYTENETLLEWETIGFEKVRL